jgi:hypothetical protein
VTASIYARPFDVQEDISPPTQHCLLDETCRLQLLTQELWSPNEPRPTCSWPLTPFGTTPGSVA